MSTGRWDKCIQCGVGIWLTAEQYDHLIRSHQNFHCIWGHSQHFTEDIGEAAKLRRERDALKQDQARLIEERDAAQRREARQRERAEHNQRSANAYKGVATKLKKRAVAGVCPCCNRHFRELERHMASKHPAFAAAPVVRKEDEVLQ